MGTRERAGTAFQKINYQMLYTIYVRKADYERAVHVILPWDGIGLAHKRQLRFHRAVCKTAIAPERCIIAPFILKGFGRCCVREHHAPSLQVPARLGTARIITWIITKKDGE